MAIATSLKANKRKRERDARQPAAVVCLSASGSSFGGGPVLAWEPEFGLAFLFFCLSFYIFSSPLFFSFNPVYLFSSLLNCFSCTVFCITNIRIQGHTLDAQLCRAGGHHGRGADLGLLHL